MASSIIEMRVECWNDDVGGGVACFIWVTQVGPSGVVFELKPD